MSIVAQPARLLFLNHSLDTGGIETLIVDLLNGLPADEFVAGVAVFEGGGALEPLVRDRGFELTDLNKRAGFDPALVLRLRRMLSRERIDIVHTHNYSAWLYAVLATTGMREVKLVHTEHSLVEGNLRRRYFAERFCAARTRHTVAVSEDVKRKMVEMCRIPAARIAVVTNGIDTDRFKPSAETRAAVRRELGIDADEFVLGTVGRLVAVKDHASLILAFSRMRREVPEARLVIVGDGPEKSALERLADANGLGDELLLAGDRRDVPSLLCAFDLYVVSSLSEGFSISILEAMSSGLPLVATAVGGNREILGEPENGLLVPADDSDALAGALERMRVNAALRATAARHNRDKILREYSMQTMLDRYLSLYRS